MYPSDRASAAFQRGYRDCRDNRTRPDLAAGTFVAHDYDEGWAACYNTQFWDAMRENDRRGNPDGLDIPTFLRR